VADDLAWRYLWRAKTVWFFALSAESTRLPRKRADTVTLT
jgi:hypothetical protein